MKARPNIDQSRLLVRDLRAFLDDQEMNPTADPAEISAVRWFAAGVEFSSSGQDGYFNAIQRIVRS